MSNIVAESEPSRTPSLARSMCRLWSFLPQEFQSPDLRLVSALAAGALMADLFWVAFTAEIPLGEFCSRNRPTWVIPLFEQARYTAISGERFLVVFASTAGLYLIALRLAVGLGSMRAAILLLGVVPVGLSLVLLPGYPVLSGDIFKYVFTGRILAVYGQNPFVHVPAEFPQDRFYDLVYWKAVVNAHGPLWRLAEAASAMVGGDSCRGAVLAMKAWPAMAYLATTWVVYLTIRAYQPERAIGGAMVYAWNPLVALEAVQNGHNDVVAALPAVVAVWLAHRRRYDWAFPLLAISVLIKPLAAVLGPLFLIAALRGPERPLRQLVLGVGVAATLVVAAYAPFWSGLETLQGLSRVHIFSTSPAAALLDVLLLVGVPADRAAMTVSTAANGLFALLSVPVLWSVWTGRLPLMPAALALVFLYCLVAAQWFNPWYLLWLMPLAAMVAYRPPRALGVVFALLAPLTYAIPYTSPVVLMVFSPMALLAARWRGWLGWSAQASDHRIAPGIVGQAGDRDDSGRSARDQISDGDTPKSCASTLTAPEDRAQWRAQPTCSTDGGADSTGDAPRRARWWWQT